MKKVHIYFHIFTLFFISYSNILFTTFDFHQEDFNQKKHIELQQKEFLKRYDELKKQLLESFKVHQDDPQLEEEKELETEEEKGCKKLQPSIQDEQEKKDANQHFLDTNQSKPFVLITLKSNDNKPIQSKFAIETAAIYGVGKAAIAWIGSLLGGGALTAAEIAAIEAAKIATAKLAAAAGGAIIAGSVVKGGIEKLSDKNNSSQEQKTQEFKKDQEFINQVNKLDQIKSLEKTNPAQAEKEREALRNSLACTDAQERKKKLAETHFPKDMPNREQALIEAGLIPDTRPGYTLVSNPSQSVINSSKTAASQTATSTEAKTSNVITQQSTTSQTLTTAKSVAEPQVPATKTATPLEQASTTAQAPTQEKIAIRSTPVTALSDSPPLNPYVAMQTFFPGQTTTTSQASTKIEVPVKQTIADTDENLISEAFASLVFPPNIDPNDNDPDDEKNTEKKEKPVPKDNSEVKKQSKATPPRSLADKKASALRKAERLAVRTIKLPDGRIRYYELEAPSKTPGPTRGSSFVTELDPKTGRVRQWNECYDHHGNVNRVRPKTINGRNIVSQHYPATYKDIQENLKGSKWHTLEKNLD